MSLKALLFHRVMSILSRRHKGLRNSIDLYLGCNAMKHYGDVLVSTVHVNLWSKLIYCLFELLKV